MALDPNNSSLLGSNPPCNDFADSATGIENNNLINSVSESEQQREQVFTLFPSFPAELRNTVWEMACFLPRSVDVWRARFTDEDDLFVKAALEDLEGIAWKFRSHTKAPSVLGTCKESRQIGLIFYHLGFESSFGFRMGGSYLNVSIPARIYINWEADIICPMPDASPKLFPYRFTSFSDVCEITSPEMQRIALPASQTQRVLPSLLQETAVKEILIYHEPDALNRPFAMQEPVLMEVEEIEGEERVKADTHKHVCEILYYTKKVAEKTLKWRESDAGIEKWGEVPDGWTPPVLKTARMIVKNCD